jgi:hypothetical protein
MEFDLESWPDMVGWWIKGQGSSIDGVGSRVQGVGTRIAAEAGRSRRRALFCAEIQHKELGRMKGQAGEALGLSLDAKSVKITHCGFPTGTQAQSTHRLSTLQVTTFS